MSICGYRLVEGVQRLVEEDFVLLLDLNCLAWSEKCMEKEQNLLVTCDRCGKPYSATITNAGKILPLGSRNGCRCGGESFSQVDTDDFDDQT